MKRVVTKEAWARHRSNLYNVPYSSTHRHVLNGVAEPDITKTVIYRAGDEMDDIVTPGFAQRSASGGIILNPMSKSHLEFEGSDGGWAMKSSNGSDVYDWSGPRYPVFPGFPKGSTSPIDVKNLTTYAQTKCLGGVKTSNFMGLVAAAEAKKTLRMLANPLGTLKTLVSHVYQLRQAGKNLHIDVVNGELRRINGTLYRVRRSKPKFGQEVRSPRSSIVVPSGEAISGSMLAYNLGLMPLLMDIDAIFKEIPKAHQVERQTFRATETESATTSDSAAFSESVFRHAKTTITTHKVTVRVAIIAGDVFSIAQDFGVSLADIVPSAYELIPYSFVVDYVLNLGDLLNAQRAQQTQSILGSATTVSIESEAVTSLTGTTSSNPGWIVTRPLIGNYRYKSVTKTRSIGLDHIGLAITPTVRMLAPSHIQNVLSLTAQQLLGLNSKASRAFY